MCPRAYTRTLFWGKIEITKSTTVKPVNDWALTSQVLTYTYVQFHKQEFFVKWNKYMQYVHCMYLHCNECKPAKLMTKPEIQLLEVKTLLIIFLLIVSLMRGLQHSLDIEEPSNYVPQYPLLHAGTSKRPYQGLSHWGSSQGICVCQAHNYKAENLCAKLYIQYTVCACWRTIMCSNNAKM